MQQTSPRSKHNPQVFPLIREEFVFVDDTDQKKMLTYASHPNLVWKAQSFKLFPLFPSRKVQPKRTGREGEGNVC